MTSAQVARESWVQEYLRAHCFRDAPSGPTQLTFGAELELLAFDKASLQVAPIVARDALGCSIDAVRGVGRELRWRETISDKGVPLFTGPTGGTFTFEPGGQLEYATAVHRAVHSVLGELRQVEALLREYAERIGIILVATGVDPYNGAEGAPLQLGATRYRRMSQYFATIGPQGARMMRQTASLQLNIGGFATADRWVVANAITPWLIALFANASRYADADTGCASYRSETWRGVDPLRTGVFSGTDAVGDYAAFALAAPAFLLDPAALPLSAVAGEQLTDTTFATHLGTLFPEVRPRGYLELRSVDSSDHEQRCGSMAFVAGILGDTVAAREALELVGPADSRLLGRAGRDGMGDERIAALAEDLVGIATDGATRLGHDIVSEELLGSLRALSIAQPGR